MDYFKIATVFVLSLGVLPLNASDACNDILRRRGAFNTIVRVSSHSSDEQTYEWLKTVTWSEFNQQQQAGLKIVLPIDGVPVSADGTYSQSQFQKFVQLRDQGKLRFFTDSEFNKTIELSASPVIAKAWVDCMKSRSTHGLTCWADQNDEQENGTVVFLARYALAPWADTNS